MLLLLTRKWNWPLLQIYNPREAYHHHTSPHTRPLPATIGVYANYDDLFANIPHSNEIPLWHSVLILTPSRSDPSSSGDTLNEGTAVVGSSSRTTTETDETWLLHNDGPERRILRVHPEQFADHPDDYRRVRWHFEWTRTEEWRHTMVQARGHVHTVPRWFIFKVRRKLLLERSF